MNLQDIIYKRQSIRKYSDKKIDDKIINELEEFINNVKVLNDKIKWYYEIVESNDVKTIMNWKAPYYIQIYSESKDNYYENIGFIFQQVDLYLQSRGIGSCWVGMAKPKSEENAEEYEFIISLAFGYSDEEIYRNKNEFNRKKLDKLSDCNDEKLEVARLAPSAMNSQPWYFTHDDNAYNIYRKKQNILKRKLLDRLNKIDMGIVLAHLYIDNKDDFEFYIKEDYDKIDGYFYEGSFKI